MGSLPGKIQQSNGKSRASGIPEKPAQITAAASAIGIRSRRVVTRKNGSRGIYLAIQEAL
jgi:hypothetical protein